MKLERKITHYPDGTLRERRAKVIRKKTPFGRHVKIRGGGSVHVTKGRFNAA